MKNLLKTITSSKYFHLSLGVLVLYGITLIVTGASRLEKIIDSLKWHCYASYEVRNSLFFEVRVEAEFYREKYRERLSSLTEGLFDYRNKYEMQNYFVNHGFLYDIGEDKRRHSYLLAKIISMGKHEAEVPEKVVFDYLILGEKRIVPFSEYRKKKYSRAFVSAGEKVIYIHRDSLEPILRWYFKSLWKTHPKKPEDFYIHLNIAPYKDASTYFLYLDLQSICEDIFMKRLYRNKKDAEDSFIREGFKVFLPTFLTMGGRMVADKDSSFSNESKYQRALLTGFSLEPNYTMFYLSYLNRNHHPSLGKLWVEIGKRLSMPVPEEITLDKISQVSRQVLQKLENASRPERKE